MDSLFIGVLVAYKMREENFFDGSMKIIYWMSGSIFFSFAAICALGYAGESVFSEHMATFGYSLFGIFYGSVLALCLFRCSRRSAHRPVTFLGSRLLKAAGKRCYSLYILHQPCIGLCFWLMTSSAPFVSEGADALVIMTAMALTVALSALSWRFIETPGISLGRQWSYARGKLDAVAAEST